MPINISKDRCTLYCGVDISSTIIIKLDYLTTVHDTELICVYVRTCTCRRGQYLWQTENSLRRFILTTKYILRSQLTNNVARLLTYFKTQLKHNGTNFATFVHHQMSWSSRNHLEAHEQTGTYLGWESHLQILQKLNNVQLKKKIHMMYDIQISQ